MPKQTYTDVVQQIQLLQARAEELKKQEASGVIARIREAVQIYGLTVEDVFGGGTAMKQARGGRKAGVKPKLARPAKASSGAQYADGNGNTWGGRGPRPRWLREALERGASLDSFLVGAGGVAPRTEDAPRAEAPAKRAKRGTGVRGRKGAPAKKATPKPASKRGSARARKGAADAGKKPSAATSDSGNAES